jgi:catechol 2,3-dioxygenase-like lactoylglutathione lyase family enzyme
MSNLTSTRVERIRCIGITVSDADRSKDFYTKALGFELISDTILTSSEYSQLVGVPDATIRVMALRLGDESIELMQYLNHPGKPIPADSQSNDLWFQHLAIAVSNLDRAYAHLKPFLAESISSKPQTMPANNPAAAGIQAFKFKDPDRHSLELIWYPPDKGQDKWHQPTKQLFLGIDHSAIAVADTEQSLQFYGNLLGMQVKGGSLNQGETQAHLDGLQDAKVRVTPLKTAQGGIGIEMLDYLIPAEERPMPNSWRSCDIAHIQVELVVNNIQQVVEQLRSKGVRFVSAQLVQLSTAMPYRQGCLVKDPNGHAMLLVEL